MAGALLAPCDQSMAFRPAGQATIRSEWVLVATILASSLAFIDGSIVNVALPAIGSSLGADAAGLQWTINAYLLPLSALLLIGGACGDHFGRRRLLVWGIVVFAVGSAGCALAANLQVLLAFRSLQGIGAAMVTPNSLAILGNAFTGSERGRAIGTWAAAGAIGGAVGPPLGGWLIGVAGWRSIFLINIPIAFAAILLALRFVRESRAGEEPLDVPGALLATLTLGAFTWSLTLWSNAGRLALEGWAGLAFATGLLALFLLVERWRGDRAMMPLGMFGSSAFIGLTLLTFLLYAALGGLLLLLPYLLLVVGGYSPLDAGLALLPFPLVIGLLSRRMGKIAERSGPRLPLTAGPIIAAAGFALLARLEPRESYWTGVLPGILVVSAGMAYAVAPLTTAVLGSVDASHTGTASGLNSAVARTGALIATALAGLVMARQGMGLVSAFHGAAAIGAIMALLAGAASLALLPRAKGPAVEPADPR